MARILITSGPTRQHLDPVRYLTNASSGRMGTALAQAALEADHDVVIVTGPVDVTYPQRAEVIHVVSTEQMLDACTSVFPHCDGMIAAAAPCDYRPVETARDKLSKTGHPLLLRLVETPDIVAALARTKRPAQWIVGFALETNNEHARAMAKLAKKNCDLIALNGPQAIDSDRNCIKLLDRTGQVLLATEGSKTDVSHGIVRAICQTLIK